MPSGDRTGPEGYGPRSGRGLGYCNGYDSPGYTRGVPRGGRGYGRRFARGFGRGFGRGYGRGLGWGRGRGYARYPIGESYSVREPAYSDDSYQPMNPDDEKSYLKDMVKSLEHELKQVKNRLQELTKTDKQETP